MAAAMLVFAGSGGAAADEVCRNSWDRLIAEVTVSVRFENRRRNVARYFDTLAPRIAQRDANGRRAAPARASTMQDGAHVGVYCLDLGDIEEIRDVPVAFDFMLGPRRIPLRLAELRAMSRRILARGSDPDTPRANVITVPSTIELSPQAEPDWVAIELAELVRLTDGQVVMHLRAHNFAKERAGATLISLYATNAGSMRCASTSFPLQGEIKLQQVNGEWLGESSNLAFNVRQRRDTSVERGACGELDLTMSLGTLPALDAGGDLLVSFAFAEVTDGPGSGKPFWTVFDEGGSVSFAGDMVWPQRVGLRVPRP